MEEYILEIAIANANNNIHSSTLRTSLYHNHDKVVLGNSDSDINNELNDNNKDNSENHDDAGNYEIGTQSNDNNDNYDNDYNNSTSFK